MSKKATKKVEETPVETEETKEAETEAVTQVKTVTPKEAPPPEPKTAKKEPVAPVIISDMPTKKPVSPVKFVDHDAKVFEWYNGLSAGEKFTMEEAAEALELTVEEVSVTLHRLQHSVLPKERLIHIVDYS